MTLRRPLLFACLLTLTACAGEFRREEMAAQAKTRMIGMAREDVLACMGIPQKKAVEGATEVWAYASTDHKTKRDAATIKPTGYAYTHGTTTRNGCTVNVVMKEGFVTAVRYVGATSSHFYTQDDQCGYAVAPCVEAP